MVHNSCLAKSFPFSNDLKLLNALLSSMPVMNKRQLQFVFVFISKLSYRFNKTVDASSIYRSENEEVMECDRQPGEKRS